MFLHLELGLALSVFILICIAVRIEGIAELIRWHATLESMAFLLLLPFATSMYKLYGNREKARRRHAILALLGVSAAFGGVICLFFNTGSPSSTLFHVHAVSGTCILIFLVLQIVVGIAKFQHFSFKWHGPFGLLLILLGLVQISTGTWLLSALDKILVASITIAIFFLVLLKAYSLFAALLSSENDDRGHHAQLDKEEAIDEESATTTLLHPQGSGYYSTFDAAAAAPVPVEAK